MHPVKVTGFQLVRKLRKRMTGCYKITMAWKVNIASSTGPIHGPNMVRLTVQYSWSYLNAFKLVHYSSYLKYGQPTGPQHSIAPSLCLDCQMDWFKEYTTFDRRKYAIALRERAFWVWNLIKQNSLTCSFFCKWKVCARLPIVPLSDRRILLDIRQLVRGMNFCCQCRCSLDGKVPVSIMHLITFCVWID